MNTWTMAIALAGVLWISAAAAADQTSRGSYPIIATGAQRQAIKSTPILDRPYYRFGHFYGNTVRRRHYRGNSSQVPRGR